MVKYFSKLKAQQSAKLKSPLLLLSLLFGDTFSSIDWSSDNFGDTFYFYFQSNTIDFQTRLFGDTFRRSDHIWWHFFASVNLNISNLVTLLIERSHLVTLLRRLRLRKIDFGTFQLGIAQLVPRVFGVTLPPSPPPKLAKKKKVPKKKKFRTRPPPLPSPYWLEIDGSDRKKFPDLTEKTVGVPAGHKTSQWPWTFSRAPVLALAKASARPAPPTRTAPCTKGQPIKSHLTAPLLTLANYLYTYIIRLLPHSLAPSYSVSFSLSAPLCPEVNMNTDPNPLLYVKLE